MDRPPPSSSSRSWSIHGRADITDRYEILGRVGSGAFSDVYRARRRLDGLAVALKEIHDYQSAIREIEALQALQGAPNIVDLIEFFWQEDEDAVLVLEFLPVDLASVIQVAKRGRDGISRGEVKQWMMQILRGVDACHGSGIVHRDIKPSNLLISAEGVLKIADFGQARILQETRFDEPAPDDEALPPQQSPTVQEVTPPPPDEPEYQNPPEPRPICEGDYLQELDGIKGKYPIDDTEKDISLQDGNASCLATCSTGDMEDDPFKDPFELTDGVADEPSDFTSCVGTRWFRAPELLFGSTNYSLEIDLWSLGCTLAELLILEPLFPGSSDIDQLGRIISVLGDAKEETWLGCSKLPDYSKISFNLVENPIGLEACLPNRTAAEVNLVRRLVCYDQRASAGELLQESYFSEEPLPVPLNELWFPSERDEHDERDSGEWGSGYRGLGADSDDEEFGRMDVTETGKGFSMRFS